MTRTIARWIVLTMLVAATSGVALARNAQSPVPVGTKITLRNWQQYRDYLSIGYQALLGGKYHWKVPDEAMLEVGPTLSYPLPPKFWQDTEKYGSQVKLRRLPNGGYALDNYVAGEPFAKPNGPLAGEELLYDLYYNYTPAVQYTAESSGHIIDRFDDVSYQELIVVFHRLSHVSDIGWNVTNPEASGIYFSFFNELLIPEQSKYTTALQLQYDDVERFPDFYTFLPSLRRSLRLTTAARCAPLQGSDFVNDDISPVPLPPTIDQATLLGEKKILAAWAPPGAEGRTFKDTNDWYQPGFYWPKAASDVKWQVRDVWVLEEKRVTSMAAGYCYGKKIYYVDKEFYSQIENESYDANMKLWKVEIGFRTPIPVPGGGVYATSAGYINMYDLQNDHASIGLQSITAVNSNVPRKYYDVGKFTLPSGLAEVMQ